MKNAKWIAGLVVLALFVIPMIGKYFGTPADQRPAIGSAVGTAVSSGVNTAWDKTTGVFTEDQSSWRQLSDELAQHGEDIGEYVPNRNGYLAKLAEAKAWLEVEWAPKPEKVEMFTYDETINVEVLDPESKDYTYTIEGDVTFLGYLDDFETMRGSRSWLLNKVMALVPSQPQEVFHIVRIEGEKGKVIPVLVRHSDAVPKAYLGDAPWDEKLPHDTKGIYMTATAVVYPGQETDSLILSMPLQTYLHGNANGYRFDIQMWGDDDLWQMDVDGTVHNIVDGEVSDLIITQEMRQKFTQEGLVMKFKLAAADAVSYVRVRIVDQDS